MDFETACSLGYYFDRCIDLEFYDSNKNFMAALKTPKNSMKPSITVKGELIEGSYSISSYISIQNMSYDININAVAYIKCRMYYSGLEEAWTTNENIEAIRNGHTILYSVLYADQEKEPPNRAVRFQCTTASFDYTRASGLIYLEMKDQNGSAKPLITIDKPVNYNGNGKKSYFQIIDLVEAFAKAYNDTIVKDELDSSSSNDESTVKKLNLKDFLLITAIKYPVELEYASTGFGIGENTIGGFIKKINNLSAMDKYKMYIHSGVIYISKIPPDDWRDVAVSKGQDDLSEYYQNNYISYENRIRYIKSSGVKGRDLIDYEKPVQLNYVKSAYRNEVVIHATTIFDDRIFPGCYCEIKGNAIMGKHRGGGRRSGSRIVSYSDEYVVFRATGGIQYEFSTTEDSFMTFVGPVIKEYKKAPVSTKPKETDPYADNLKR